MADPDGRPRRVSMTYLLGLSNKPFKDPPRRSTQAKSFTQMMKTPGGFIEWTASDGRKGKLTGRGKQRLTAASLAKIPSEKRSVNHAFTKTSEKKHVGTIKTVSNMGELFLGGDALDEHNNMAANNNGWTEEQDKRLMEIKTDEPSTPWNKIAEEVGKPQDQCKERFKQIKPGDWKPNVAKRSGGKKGKDKQENQNNQNDSNTKAKKDEPTNGDPADQWGGDTWGDTFETYNNNQTDWKNNKTNTGGADGGPGPTDTTWNNIPNNGDTDLWGKDEWANNDNNNAWNQPTVGSNRHGTSKAGGGGVATGETDAWNNVGDEWNYARTENRSANNGGRSGPTRGTGACNDTNGFQNSAGERDEWANNGGGRDTKGGWDANRLRSNNNSRDTSDPRAAQLPPIFTSKPNSKPATDHVAAQHRSRHHSQNHVQLHTEHQAENMPTSNNTGANMLAPRSYEIEPDATFSADDLRLIARILQQDSSLVWNRVSWRFKDKTGRELHPGVFEKKITGKMKD
ncbi:hypothetical protein BKA66DRAFT_437604 [Pyrenochaeta sp. MPI-SDFR-AT-0127]|nr:hypothetical protein BKA66DRAFT_437604 [Pyrenochaeta sp. MPI-SDFR-AT-0127]